MMDRIKSFMWSDKVFYTSVMVLMSVSAYGLGLQSGRLAEQETAFSTTQPAIVFNTVRAIEVPSDSVSVVTSRSGTKYHLPTCPGAKQIMEANLVRFASIDLARAAGYLPAGNCQGLE